MLTWGIFLISEWHGTAQVAVGSRSFRRVVLDFIKDQAKKPI